MAFARASLARGPTFPMKISVSGLSSEGHKRAPSVSQGAPKPLQKSQEHVFRPGGKVSRPEEHALFCRAARVMPVVADEDLLAVAWVGPTTPHRSSFCRPRPRRSADMLALFGSPGGFMG